jgi:hypothetical protein
MRRLKSIYSTATPLQIAEIASVTEIIYKVYG